MIGESGRISQQLSHRLSHVVNMYSRRVAQILEMASAGAPSERPHFTVITSMMALDPHFLTLFAKIRNRIDNPFTPVMCVDSLEHEYLIANHLFEMYVNPAQGDRRLDFSVESAGIRHALMVVQSAGGDRRTFSFSSLMESVSGAISDGTASPGKLVLVGADNDDALAAAVNAGNSVCWRRWCSSAIPRTFKKLRNIRESRWIRSGTKVWRSSPSTRWRWILKKRRNPWRRFLAISFRRNPEFIVMKGSISTAPLLHKALSIYSGPGDSGEGQRKRRASHTALFVLPDGRFFALSDAGVNPGFRNPDALPHGNREPGRDRAQAGRARQDTQGGNHHCRRETDLRPSRQHTLPRRPPSKPRHWMSVMAHSWWKAPLSFDLATVPEVSEEKHYEGLIRGDADCLVATDINTANVLYKMLSKTMGSLGLIVDTGSLITAGPGSVPIVLTSRGDTAQTKMNSILLALAYCRRRGD